MSVTGVYANSNVEMSLLQIAMVFIWKHSWIEKKHPHLTCVFPWSHFASPYYYFSFSITPPPPFYILKKGLCLICIKKHPHLDWKTSFFLAKHDCFWLLVFPPFLKNIQSLNVLNASEAHATGGRCAKSRHEEHGMKIQ